MNTLSVFSEWNPKSLGWPPKPSAPVSLLLLTHRRQGFKSPSFALQHQCCANFVLLPKGPSRPSPTKVQGQIQLPRCPCTGRIRPQLTEGGAAYTPPPTPNHVSQRHRRTAASHPIYFWSWRPGGEGGRVGDTNQLFGFEQTGKLLPSSVSSCIICRWRRTDLMRVSWGAEGITHVGST